jgi:hypothetical protein
MTTRMNLTVYVANKPYNKIPHITKKYPGLLHCQELSTAPFSGGEGFYWGIHCIGTTSAET